VKVPLATLHAPLRLCFMDLSNECPGWYSYVGFLLRVFSLFQPTSTNLDAGPMFTERGLYLEATYVLWVMITVLVQKARLH